MKASIDIFLLGKKWPVKLEQGIKHYIPDAVLHAPSDKIDISKCVSDWWMYVYECEDISEPIYRILPILVDPSLRNPKTGRRYKGFTFFLIDTNNTVELYYSSRLFHKDTPFNFHKLMPLVDTDFERILDGWIYTNEPHTSLNQRAETDS